MACYKNIFLCKDCVLSASSLNLTLPFVTTSKTRACPHNITPLRLVLVIRIRPQARALYQSSQYPTGAGEDIVYCQWFRRYIWWPTSILEQESFRTHSVWLVVLELGTCTIMLCSEGKSICGKVDVYHGFSQDRLMTWMQIYPKPISQSGIGLNISLISSISACLDL